MLPRFADKDGIIRGPVADGRVSAVSRDDIAEVAAAVLLDDGRPSAHDGTVYEVTGPAAVTMDEAAAQLSRATGQAYAYQDESAARTRARRRALGDGTGSLQNRVTWFQAIAAGEVAAVTDVVARLAGHAPRSIEASADLGESR